jgi:tripartite-type tricarboxylate transporter receptor subunit TctC
VTVIGNGRWQAPRIGRRAFTLGLIGAIGSLALARAQSYPARTILIINPNAPGGVNDVLGRIVAQKLQEQFGKAVVIESRPGAGGDIGTEAVVKAEPDGYMLVIASTSLTLKPSLYKSLRFDPRKDLTAIARLATQPMIVVVRPDFPAASLSDFIAMAKASPGKFSFGTPGPGTPQHFGAEMLCAEAGIKLVHVPYKGAVPAMTDIMSGHIDLYYATETSGGPHIAAGKMKPLAVTGEKRLASLPDVKTLGELGLPQAAIAIWYGLFGPSKLPGDVVARLSAELKIMSSSEDYEKRLMTLALENALSTQQEMASQIKREIPLWQGVAAAAGIKPED